MKEQIKRAQKDAAARGVVLEETGEEAAGRELKRVDGAKIVISFGGKPATPAPQTPTEEPNGSTENDETSKPPVEPAAKPISIKFGAKPPVKNVFKNALAGAPKRVMAAQPKKMSEAERIMKEEIERKRAREAGGGPPKKRPRM